MTNVDADKLVVRRLRPDDLEVVIALDAKNTGRRREEFFKVKLAQALADTGIEISLAAERDGLFVGFLLARVYYGEFGSMEQVAMLDTLGVHADYHGQGIGDALMHQLRTNLLGLGIRTLQTEVNWDDQGLMAFFHKQGFTPAPRICLQVDLETAQRRDETAI